MPIDVTPAPWQMARSNMLYPGCYSMPPTGPARQADLYPSPRIPGSIYPNGLRNPYAPYEGKSYVPAAESCALQGDARYASSSFTGSIAGACGAGVGRAKSHSRSGGGGSVIAPFSVDFAGYREDDGWNGSMGRVHAGHEPDMSSVAGALSQPRNMSGWTNQPASWGNHARMTPTVAAALAGGSDFGGPPVEPLHHHMSSSVPSARGRRNSIIEEECTDCYSTRSRSLGHRRHSRSPVAISGSPLRRVKELHVPVDQCLKRSGSGRSSRCSECY